MIRLCMVLTAAAVLFASCSLFERKSAVLWTDRPEFVAYVEAFNQAQSRYKVEVQYRESPSQALLESKDAPDIAVGSWLKSGSTRQCFKPLDYVFEKFSVSQSAFYPALLSLGYIEGRQYLLPVSFNIPALGFSRSNAQLVTDPDTLPLEEVRRLGKAYNKLEGGSFVRMGFSPRWDDDFLYIASSMFGTSFREGNPLSWNDKALKESIAWLRSWSREENRSPDEEDDFAFKYLADPSLGEVGKGRMLFAYIPSQAFFLLPQDRRTAVDFRWASKDGHIPLAEKSVYLGLCKKGKAPAAADAFVSWFFREENQKELLRQVHERHLDSRVFGIANGFSAIRRVNEDDYPLYYPSLLGHVPPASMLWAPRILPKNWELMKQKVILPWLHEEVRAEKDSEGPGLKDRIRDWVRQNPTL